MLRLKAALANAVTRVKMEVRIVAQDRVVADKDVRFVELCTPTI